MERRFIKTAGGKKYCRWHQHAELTEKLKQTRPSDRSNMINSGTSVRKCDDVDDLNELSNVTASAGVCGCLQVNNLMTNLIF